MKTTTLSYYIFSSNGYHDDGVNSVRLGVDVVESAVIQMHLQNRGTESDHKLVILHTLIPTKQTTALLTLWKCRLLHLFRRNNSRMLHTFVKEPETKRI